MNQFDIYSDEELTEIVDTLRYNAFHSEGGTQEKIIARHNSALNELLHRGLIPAWLVVKRSI